MNTQCSNICGIIHLLPADLCFALLCTGLISIGCWVLYMENCKICFKPGVFIIFFWRRCPKLLAGTGVLGAQGPNFLSLRDCGWELGSRSWMAWIFIAPKYWEEGVPVPLLISGFL